MKRERVTDGLRKISEIVRTHPFPLIGAHIDRKRIDVAPLGRTEIRGELAHLVRLSFTRFGEQHTELSILTIKMIDQRLRTRRGSFVRRRNIDRASHEVLRSAGDLIEIRLESVFQEIEKIAANRHRRAEVCKNGFDTVAMSRPERIRRDDLRNSRTHDRGPRLGHRFLPTVGQKIKNVDWIVVAGSDIRAPVNRPLTSNAHDRFRIDARSRRQIDETRNVRKGEPFHMCRKPSQIVARLRLRVTSRHLRTKIRELFHSLRRRGVVIAHAA